MFGSINIKLIIDFQGTLDKFFEKWNLHGTEFIFKLRGNTKYKKCQQLYHVINLNFRTVFPSLFFFYKCSWRCCNFN